VAMASYKALQSERSCVTYISKESHL